MKRRVFVGALGVMRLCRIEYQFMLALGFGEVQSNIIFVFIGGADEAGARDSDGTDQRLFVEVGEMPVLRGLGGLESVRTPSAPMSLGHHWPTEIFIPSRMRSVLRQRCA